MEKTVVTCRMCDKVTIGGVCAIDGHTIKDFDAECKFTEDMINKYEQAKKVPIITISHAHLLNTGI